MDGGRGKFRRIWRKGDFGEEEGMGFDAGGWSINWIKFFIGFIYF